MRYLKKALQDNERPICRSHLHWIYMATGFVWLLFLAGIGWTSDIALWNYYGEAIPEYILTAPFQLSLEPGFIGWFFTAGGAFIFVAQWLNFISTDLVVTTRRVLYKRGLMKVKIDGTDIGDILGAHIDQGWFGQFFGYGKLHLDCRFIEDVYIPYVKNPYGVMHAIQKVKDAAAEHSHAPIQPSSQTIVQITGNSPVYLIDRVPNDPTTPLKHLPKSLGDNMINTFRRKA